MFKVLKKKNPAHFLHIGKTGGSAIKSALKGNLKNLGYDLKLHGHDVKLKNIPTGDSVIFFLRDPISRFISGFYSRQRKGQPRYYSEWSSDEEQAFSAFKTPNELACALSEESSSRHALAGEAMECIEHLKHFDYWYESVSYFKTRVDDILFVGFQESLEQDFNELKQILDVKNSVELPSDDIRAHRNPSKLDRLLDDNAIRALKVWYQSDIEFIALCKEVMSIK